MLTPIKDEMNLLCNVLQMLIATTSAEREDIQNPNLYNEYTGRITSHVEALHEVQLTSVNIDKHIEYILQNTVDGNYAAKLGVLEDENRVLRDKQYLMEKEMDKMKKIKKDRKVLSKPGYTHDVNIEERLEL